MFRPCGQLDWALNLSDSKQWFFVGALNAEERSLAAWKLLRELQVENGRAFLEIDALPSRFYQRTLERLSAQRKEFLELGGRNQEIEPVDLLAELHLIESIAERLQQRSSSVILDITSLPKRFFFPLLRSFARCNTIKDLIITYTSPSEYDDVLSEGSSTWEYLPGFPGSGRRSEMLIVGVGFLVESLQQNLSSIEAHDAIHLLIPFPAPLSVLHRTWKALFNIRADRNPNKFVNHRVDGNDISSAFDRIVSLTSDKTVPTAFAPFGPKPISAAMCLYAIQQEDCAIYYPQPLYYNPDYSKGVRLNAGKPAIHAYWIKHNGEFLYQMT